ncbi:MAG: hypothetical protein HOV87_00330 [Catenulispora sp.]|nr:hypothetical protein [Catenulispora sp.]
MDIDDESTGLRFARALAAKDQAVLRGCLAEEIDFQALTPGRHWQAASSGELVEKIVLGHWFQDDDRIQALRSASDEPVLRRRRLVYELAVANADGEFLVEQQAYYQCGEDGRITWMRLLCAGYQAADA